VTLTVTGCGLPYSDDDGKEQADGDGLDAPVSRIPPRREVDYVRAQRGPATSWVYLKVAERQSMFPPLAHTSQTRLACAGAGFDQGSCMFMRRQRSSRMVP